MPEHIYPSGSFDSTYNDLVASQNYGLPDLMRDAFERKLIEPEKTTPPLLVYPLDLGEATDHQFSIRFDIFQTGGANLNRNRYFQNLFYDNIQANIKESEGKLSFSQAGNIVGSGVSPVLDYLGVGSVFSETQPTSTLSGQIGSGRDSFVEEEMGLNELTEHVGSVYLYLPGAINIGYKFEYEDADLSSMEILKGLRSLTETQTADTGALQAEIARKIGMSALKANKYIDLGDKFYKRLSAQARQVENPFVVHMFKGVGRRTFRFTFNLIPRSEKEAKSIDNIVTIFRKFAHPKRSPKGRFLDFPAEFTIAFLHKNQENIRLPRVRKCALTGINLTYGENVFTSTKPDARGIVSPTKISMELEFAELEILTQQNIVDQGA